MPPTAPIAMVTGQALPRQTRTGDTDVATLQAEFDNVHRRCLLSMTEHGECDVRPNAPNAPDTCKQPPTFSALALLLVGARSEPCSGSDIRLFSEECVN